MVFKTEVLGGKHTHTHARTEHSLLHCYKWKD